jgi:hypothetical protein
MRLDLKGITSGKWNELAAPGLSLTRRKGGVHTYRENLEILSLFDPVNWLSILFCMLSCLSDLLSRMTIAENTKESYSPLGIERGSLETVSRTYDRSATAL